LRPITAVATISHDGQTLDLVGGKSVFDYADDLKVQVPTSCRRAGTCHECVVEIDRGMEALCPRTPAESFLRGNYRLACQARVENPGVDVRFAPLRRRLKILVETQSKPMQVDPLVTRAGHSVLYDGEPIDRYRGHLYGLAIDLGTTTVVMELVDLESGASLCTSAFANPQQFGGSDVMNRISYDSGAFRGELQRAVVNAINAEIRELRRRFKFARHEICEVVVAGNSTMRDLLFGLDVHSIGQRPYKSVVEHEFLAGRRSTTSVCEEAPRIGLRVNPKARVYGLPLVASHVGGDTAADLVAVDMASEDEVVMLVDVGTNTEVVVGNGQRMLAASCPAGPAFEGGLVKYGMPGFDGAIESLRLQDGHFRYHTIGDVAPRGICGSGLIDLLAELRRHGRMTPKGVFSGKLYEMPIVPEHGITLSREDASNLAQAKAANYCGQMIVMRKFGVNPRDIARLYLAGGFANYIDVRNAIEIGFLAPVPQERIVKVGNASVQGAKEVLLSRRKRESIEQLVRRIEHVELETTPDFFEVFVEGCQFKPMPEVVVGG
jgi:uncharacterized 2Fe-2S/4Fe-4S cluster protein (DUF4445 family)